MKEYTINIAGLSHTVLLDEVEAKRIGAKPVETKQAPSPANKARVPANKKG